VSNKAAFFDRDGVINEDHGFVSSWKDFEYKKNIKKYLRIIQDNGYLIFIVTNQSGIARGLYTESKFLSLTSSIEKDLKRSNIFIKETFYCPHHPQGSIKKYSKSCNCRKPKPGMILEAKEKYNLNLKDSVLFGDKFSDYEAAKSAGIGSIFIMNSKYTSDQPNKIKLYDCLKHPLEILLEISNEKS
tara:strand:+ start:569 stop:1129 length:561 start_codon:yes stop_codon:yes gene_type:complete